MKNAVAYKNGKYEVWPLLDSYLWALNIPPCAAVDHIFSASKQVESSSSLIILIIIKIILVIFIICFAGADMNMGMFNAQLSRFLQLHRIIFSPMLQFEQFCHHYHYHHHFYPLSFYPQKGKVGTFASCSYQTLEVDLLNAKLMFNIYSSAQLAFGWDPG